MHYIIDTSVMYTYIHNIALEKVQTVLIEYHFLPIHLLYDQFCIFGIVTFVNNCYEKYSNFRNRPN